MHSTFEASRQAAEIRVVQALGEIFDHPDERRQAARRPYFGPVMVTLPSAPMLRFSAFARDVSPLGIGLVHVMAIEQGEVIVAVPLDKRGVVSFRTQIVWCRNHGDGWFASGGRLLDVVCLPEN